jgi:hypothetical protein
MLKYYLISILKKMKKYLFTLPILLLFAILTGCNNYGKEKVFDGVELYHTEKVTDAQADTLGNYLVNGKFADGSAKTVQLTKSGDTIQFRMVVKEGVDKDPQYTKTMKFFATLLSAQVFNGAPLQVQLCDDQFSTLKVFSADDYGKEKIFNGVGLLHSKNITDAQVDSLGNYLISSKFADGNAKSVLITKSGNTYQFKFVAKQGADKDPESLKNGKLFASQLSAGVFNNAPVEVHMCDDYLNTVMVLPMDNSTKKM